MKTRLGVVSNSSTSSFVVVGFLLDSEAFPLKKIMSVIWGNEPDFPKEDPAERKRGCMHKEVQGAKFCPECGKETWVENPYNDFDDTLRDYLYDKRDESDFTIRDNSDDGAPDGKTLVGVQAACWSDENGTAEESERELESVLEQLRELRTGLGLGEKEPVKLVVGTCMS